MGKAQLHSIRALVRGLNAPLEIASANLSLTPDQVSVQNLTASVADTSWYGSLALPRECAAPDACPIHFDLHADEIATDELNQLINPHVRKQPWYRFLSSPVAGVPYLLTVNATGKVTANRVVVHKLVGNRVSAKLELNKGKVRLFDLCGDVLGGKHVGEWEADFTVKPPDYSGAGTLDGIALSQLSNSMNDDWVTGSATATYHVKTSGLDAAELFASATGTLKVDAHEGSFEIQEGALQTSTGAYQVSGTASLTRILDLKLTREGTPGFNVTGTVMEPRVSPIVSSDTQAVALKP
jgi:hypothetical protein